MKYIRAIVSIAIAQCAGIIGSLFTTANIPTGYATLTLPAWNPPSWIFAPVWTTLYALMGVAAFIVWEQRRMDGRVPFALSVYGIQLVLNAAWSIIFFGMHNIGLALAELIVLDIFILITLVLFWRIRPIAGVLLLPYLTWALFATYLNYTILMLN